MTGHLEKMTKFTMTKFAKTKFTMTKFTMFKFAMKRFNILNSLCEMIMHIVSSGCLQIYRKFPNSP